MNSADFHFLRPAWLLLLLPSALLLWQFWRQKIGLGFWQQICDPELIPHVVTTSVSQRRHRQLVPYALAGLLGITALAGPTAQRQPRPVFREQAGLVILLDLSRSMSAADIAPSRLVRARYKIKDILAARDSGQTGLVVFAAQPFTVAPLTDDARTIDAQLSVLTPELMPSQGSDIPAAIKQGIELLRQAGYRHGDLLLLTDGIATAQLGPARAALSASGVRLSVLGFGTPNGAPIPQPDGGFVTDSQGGIVISQLDAGALTQLAQITQGVYQTVAPTNLDVEALVAVFKQHRQRAAVTRTNETASQWRDLGPWLLIPLLVCAAFAFRPGLAFLVLLGVGSMMSKPAQADWWLTPDQAGQRAFDAQDYPHAADQFKDQHWRAAAHFRANNFEGVVAELKRARDPEDLYNKGNALARLGRFEDAIATYNEVLKKVPDHADASHNRDLIEKLLNQQNPDNKSKPEDQQEQARREQPQDGAGQNKQGENGQKQGEQDGRDTQMRPPNESDDPAQAETDKSEQESSREMTKQSSSKNGAKAETDAAKAESQAEKAANAAPGNPEQALATEQWLRQIPDDPGGLLRRKFQYQYSRRSAEHPPSETPW